ncbi:MAG: hypothetical protein LUF85_07770 [Bacteroides sp.]|nr:hypothetical protein [Bacteroides sp.]
MKRIPTFILSFLSFTMLVAQHRQTIDLSVLPWEITLDKEATWQDDELSWNGYTKDIR